MKPSISLDGLVCLTVYVLLVKLVIYLFGFNLKYLVQGILSCFLVKSLNKLWSCKTSPVEIILARASCVAVK